MATPHDELYSYSLLLKLQPYLDEQLLEAAQAQALVLQPQPPAAKA